MEYGIFIVYILALAFAVKVVLFSSCGGEGMASKPNPAQRAQMVNEVLRNSNVFQNEGFTMLDARKRMRWMDAIAYEDLRNLAKENRLTEGNINIAIGG